jgi:hypothetical protein
MTTEINETNVRTFPVLSIDAWGNGGLDHDKRNKRNQTYKLFPSYPLTHGETLKTGTNGTNGST